MKTIKKHIVCTLKGNVLTDKEAILVEDVLGLIDELVKHCPINTKEKPCKGCCALEELKSRITGK